MLVQCRICIYRVGYGTTEKKNSYSTNMTLKKNNKLSTVIPVLRDILIYGQWVWCFKTGSTVISSHKICVHLPSHEVWQTLLWLLSLYCSDRNHYQCIRQNRLSDSGVIIENLSFYFLLLKNRRTQHCRRKFGNNFCFHFKTQWVERQFFNYQCISGLKIYCALYSRNYSGQKFEFSCGRLDNDPKGCHTTDWAKNKVKLLTKTWNWGEGMNGLSKTIYTLLHVMENILCTSKCFYKAAAIIVTCSTPNHSPSEGQQIWPNTHVSPEQGDCKIPQCICQRQGR